MADIQNIPSRSIIIEVDSDGRPIASEATITKPTWITFELDNTNPAADGGVSAKDRWDLVSIEWKASAGADPAEFTDWEGSGKNNGKKIKVKDACSKQADFNYRIWVVSSDGLGHPECSADPTIKNVPE